MRLIFIIATHSSGDIIINYLYKSLVSIHNILYDVGYQQQLSAAVAAAAAVVAESNIGKTL